MAPLTHHPFVSKSQAPSGWNLLQQVAPLTHLAPVTHHRTVVGTCHWWVTGRRPNSLEYQICTAPEPFDTLVTGLGQGGLLSCQAENLGVANTLLLTHCMRIGNQQYGRMFSFNLRTIQVHVKGEQALVYRELELKVDALQDRS